MNNPGKMHRGVFKGVRDVTRNRSCVVTAV